jgi:recombinational DNA repair protein (RecF pathway)
VIGRWIRRLARALRRRFTGARDQRCSRCGARENLAYLTPTSREILCVSCFRQELRNTHQSQGTSRD